MSPRFEIDMIALHKAMAWEEAKGKLRTVAAIEGTIPSGMVRSPDWEEIKKKIEDFITNFESEGMHY
jgi:hypothetical protein